MNLYELKIDLDEVGHVLVVAETWDKARAAFARSDWNEGASFMEGIDCIETCRRTVRNVEGPARVIIEPSREKALVEANAAAQNCDVEWIPETEYETYDYYLVPKPAEAPASGSQNNSSES